MTSIYLAVGDADVADQLGVEAGLTGYGIVNGSFSAPYVAGDRFRVVSWVEDVRGSTGDDLYDKIRAIQTKLNQATAAQGAYGHGARVTLAVKLGSASNYTYFDVVSGSIDLASANIFGPYVDAAAAPFVSIALLCQPYLRGPAVSTTVSGTITTTNGTFAVPGGAGAGGLFLANVPGDVPALARHIITDVSTGAQFINRLRINAFSLPDPASVIAQSAFTPWIDDTPSGSGTALADATAVGGSASSINLNSSLQRVAQYPKPSGAYTTGLFDIFARVRDATTLLDAPTLTDLAVKNDVNLPERQSAAYTSTSSSTATPVWTNATLAGSTLILGVMIQGNQTITVPAGWTAGPTVTHASLTCKVAVYTIANAASRSGTETITLSSAVRCTASVIELVGGAYASPVDIAVTATATGTSVVVTSGTLSQATEMVYGFCAQSAGTQNTATSAFNDAATLLATNRATVGRARANAVTSHTMTFSHTTGSFDHAAAIISIKQQQNIPVNIPAGTYEVGIVSATAGDVYPSGLSNTSTVVITQTDSVILAEWMAGSGGASIDHYRLYYRLVGGSWEYYAMPAASPYLAYTIVADAGTAGNPPGSGPEATFVHFLVALSSGIQTYFTQARPTRVGSGLWEWLYLGTAPFPPMPASDGAAPRDWIGFLEAKNTSGSGTFDADAVVLLPHPVPSADNAHTVIAEYKNLALANLRRWNVETNRTGATFGYLSQVGTDTEAGQLTVVGESLISPGDAWLTLLADMAGGVSDTTNAAVTWQVTYTPRYLWFKGST